MGKSWVILEKDDSNNFKVLAGTEDKAAINVALLAMIDYKAKCSKENKIDLTIIRASVEEDQSPINKILNQEEGESVDRLMSMVDL
jgi:hypothetical protein